MIRNIDYKTINPLKMPQGKNLDKFAKQGAIQTKLIFVLKIEEQKSPLS